MQVISGGEEQRMVFGKLMLQRNNVLMLDEPTNHLDMECIESLNSALEKFTGTLIFVSHDREFVSSLATRIFELKPGEKGQPATLVDYQGNYEDYLLAVQEAGKLYRHIEAKKGAGTFVTEVSMDETDLPQTPLEMFFILAAIADERIPAQTIAPKFTGRFNKGVDYVGDVAKFAREFEDDLCVIAFAIKEFGLPDNLKLSVHSGSYKFSLYGPIRKAIRKHGAGLHLKTAGTTWLEECIGLAQAGGDGLQIAREIYRKAHGRFDELCGPYATVIDIDRAKLPTPDEVERWSGDQYVKALRHDLSCREFNPNFRQLLHVGYKVAAEMGARYLQALETHEPVIAGNVMQNIYDRHLQQLFC